MGWMCWDSPKALPQGHLPPAPSEQHQQDLALGQQAAPWPTTQLSSVE